MSKKLRRNSKNTKGEGKGGGESAHFTLSNEKYLRNFLMSKKSIFPQYQSKH